MNTEEIIVNPEIVEEAITVVAENKGLKIGLAAGATGLAGVLLWLAWKKLVAPRIAANRKARKASEVDATIEVDEFAEFNDVLDD